MANSNFKVFAESVSSTNVVTDDEYATNTQRINGVVPGLAAADLHNKLYKQATIMAAALAQVMVERGFNAMDDDYEGLVQSLRQAFAYTVNDKKPNSSGNIDYRLLSFSDVYPVGSIYMSVDDTNPATLFGGTWERIAGGRCLIGADDSYLAGRQGGEATHALTYDELPAHTHSATATSGGEHKHNRGTMNITGAIKLWKYYDVSGAFQVNGSWGWAETKNGGGDPTAKVEFDASRTWTGETSAAGAHQHTVTVSEAGGGKAFNNMPPYLVVNIWKRTA